jgi:nucleotide-binding universal stress UspA family protein
MSYPTILLLLDDDQHADARNEAAIEFALRCGAHLHGLACHVAVPTGPEFAVAPGGPNDPVRRDLEAGERQALERVRGFGQSCARRRVASFETSLDDSGEPAHAVLRHAPLHDLVLLGQPDPLDPDLHRRDAIVQDIVLRNPRPTLLYPYAGDFRQLARTALIAWDGSHGAARAVSDALPLLRGCRNVLVAQFDRGSPQFPASGQSPLAGLERWLRRHGIEAQAGVHFTDADIGVELLSHASDIGADLLVMGSWGHGRWRERLLGGVTRTVLTNMGLPVITSH